MADGKTTQLTPINLNGQTQGSPSMSVKGMVENSTTRPPNMPKKGDAPKSSMFDGPYGGKKPVS